jgi:hypothetical protein
MKRPMAFNAVGSLLFSIGLIGIMADCLRTHGLELVPSINLFNMIAGVGLLKLWRVARWYSLFVFGSTLVCGLPMTVWAVLNSERIVFQFPSILIDDRPHAIVPTLLVVLIMIGYLAISTWAVLILMRRNVRELFQQKINSPTALVPI